MILTSSRGKFGVLRQQLLPKRPSFVSGFAVPRISLPPLIGYSTKAKLLSGGAQWASGTPNPLQLAAIAALQAQSSPDNRQAQSDAKSAGGEVLQRRTTGAFQRLPQVPLAEDHLRSALKRASKVQGNAKLKNKALHAKNLAARRLDTLTQELTTPMGRIVQAFHATQARLHPFEEALLDLTVGLDSFNKRVKKMDNVRKSCLEVGKSHTGKVAKAVNQKDALATMETGFEAIETTFRQGARTMDAVKEIAQMLRKLHSLDPSTPSVVLVGAPNVGKSSLVQVLSSGLPEICNYPFTTRTVKMGHFYLNGRKRQVTDTPGVLDREDEDRNAMEKLTLACLQHIPCIVIFVIDLTEECGTSRQSQWNIRETLKSRFPDKEWLDVFSKADMLDAFLKPKSQQETEEGPEGNLSAAAFLKALPLALKISATTEDGICDLQSSILQMLQSVDESAEMNQESATSTSIERPLAVL